MGKVFLVGAGPGDPELLTVKAVRTLAAADVVLHDALVTREILELVPPKAHIIDVGKRCGQKLLTQEEINSYLIHAAAHNSVVVRLKSGDPLVFGRAGEEIEALKNAGVDFEIVSGITSALAAAAAARISLTDRRLASQILFTTAHRKGGAVELDWVSAIGPTTTVAVYMPGGTCAELAEALAAGGLDPRTPCVIVSAAAQESQRIHWINIAGLRSFRGIAAPAMLIIGWVAHPEAKIISEHICNELQVRIADEQRIPS